MPFDDLNQSSRLDLDFDPNANFDDSALSPNMMSAIQSCMSGEEEEEEGSEVVSKAPSSNAPSSASPGSVPSSKASGSRASRSRSRGSAASSRSSHGSKSSSASSNSKSSSTRSSRSSAASSRSSRSSASPPGGGSAASTKSAASSVVQSEAASSAMEGEEATRNSSYVSRNSSEGTPSDNHYGMNGHQDNSEMNGHHHEDSTRREGRSRTQSPVSHNSSARGNSREDREEDETNEKKEIYSQSLMNGFDAATNNTHTHQHNDVKSFSSNGVKSSSIERGVERENTHSTLDTASDLPNVQVPNKKMVKIRLWDPGETSHHPSIVTVAMDVLSKKPTQLGNIKDNTDMCVGKKIQLQHNGDLKVGNSDMGENTVDITWMPPFSLTSTEDEKETAWQPPVTLSEDDRKRTDMIKNRLNNPQPQQQLPPRMDNSSSRRATTTSKGTTSVSSSVKGLEPFTIPSIISCTHVKETPSQKVGLAFRKANGAVLIEKIVPGSPFDGTDLRPGYECLSINGHRLRSARRAAEIVRESGTSLTLLASNAPRPPGTMYTMISLKNQSSSILSSVGKDNAVGMYFTMKHGLVQLVKIHSDSPIASTSMKVGDFVLAINRSVIGSINKAVEVLSDTNYSSDNDMMMIPILYFNMRQLRVSLVDKVIGDLWKKEWSDGYDECVVLQPGKGNSNPLTLRFKEEGMCELLDPLRGFRNKSSEVPPDHPLKSVVETLNHGIMCVLSAIREGVELVTTDVLMERRNKMTG